MIAQSNEHAIGNVIGHITVNEHVASQRFNRFVDERLKDWMRDHLPTGSSSEYEVAFFDEDSLGEVSCLIVIQCGKPGKPRTIRGSRLTAALIICTAKNRPTTRRLFQNSRT